MHGEIPVDQVRVLVVDDHPVVRDGFKHMLESSSRIRVVAEASTGAEALEKVRLTLPAVVLMDVEMPDMDGLEATRRVRGLFPETRVLVMTVHDEDGLIAEALRAGASGYLLKNAPRGEICQAVEAAARGETVFKASLLHRAVLAMQGAPLRNNVHRQQHRCSQTTTG